MPKVQDVYNTVNKLAPFSLAESWDNVGLLIGSSEQHVDRAIVALDATGRVIEEAVREKAQLVVTHHPVIFSPLKSLAAGSPVYRLAQAGISVISAHTNLDIARGGVNDALAQRLGLQELRPFKATQNGPYYKITVMVPAGAAEAVYEAMSGAGAGTLGNYSGCAFAAKGEGRFRPEAGANPHIGVVDRLERVEEIRLEMLVQPPLLMDVLAAMRSAHPYEEPAFDVLHNHAVNYTESLGRVGRLPAPMEPNELAAHVKERLGVGGVKYVAGRGKIDTVAVCGGSGADLMELAKGSGAQALVTGECKHHLLLEAGELGFTLIDGGHHATEAVVLEPLCERLTGQMPEIKFSVALSDGDGVLYL